MKKANKIIAVLREKGIAFFLKKVIYRILKIRIKKISYIQNLFKSKSGLEIGGPSMIFNDNGFIPIYKVLNGLDGCNFSNSTIWEGNIESGEKYNYYEERKGFQYISEAADLNHIINSKYDFIISSNCLEHVANPFKAIEEWIRVTKKGGIILIVLPNKKYCFDHKRPITEFSHLLNDFKNQTAEDDLTHLNEILELHDLNMDKPAGNLEQFTDRSKKNFEYRALHHHVYSVKLLKEIFNYFKLEILMTDEQQDLVIIGQKN